jgi:deazaflavin-dependent oxidoreductase (nitroreductase family)
MAHSLDVVAVRVAHERAVIVRVVFGPDPRLVQHLGTGAHGRREERVDGGPAGRLERDVRLPEAGALFAGAEPEVGFRVDAEAHDISEVHQSRGAERGQDSVVEGGADGYVGALDPKVIEHRDILAARPVSQNYRRCMPNDLVLKTGNWIHRAILKVSGGRVGWAVSKMPVLEMTTVGRKSGEPRTVMLTSPYQKGDTIVVVASKGGDANHPAWFLNLRDHPEVEVTMKDQPKRTMTARIATPDERAEIWPVITKTHANYAGYQTKTDREIPLVLLEPPR